MHKTFSIVTFMMTFAFVVWSVTTSHAKAQVTRDQNSFVVLLDHEDCGSAEKIADAISAATGPIATPIAAVAAAVSSVIYTVDLIGGNHGVEISGAFGSANLVVLPRGNGIFGTVLKTLGDVQKFALSHDPGYLLSRVGLNYVTHLFGDKAGTVHANERDAGSEEQFVMFTEKNGKVAFLTYEGYLSASSDEQFVWGNKSELLRDEQFDLIGNKDGTISLRCWMNSYVCADRNKDGFQVVVGRPSIGPWEKFHLVYLGDGKVALKTIIDPHVEKNFTIQVGGVPDYHFPGRKFGSHIETFRPYERFFSVAP